MDCIRWMQLCGLLIVLMCKHKLAMTPVEVGDDEVLFAQCWGKLLLMLQGKHKVVNRLLADNSPKWVVGILTLPG